MEKKYCEFLDEISADDLYEGLLGYGMFADKLPPVFTSKVFLDYCEAENPVFSNKDWHGYVTFSAMRNTNIPRLFGIPTPMKYERLCTTLKENWNNIKAHFHSQTDELTYRISRIHLRKMHDSNSLFEMNYKNWRVDGNPETDLLFSNHSASKYIVKADISTCFPSIYTHALPWAFVGRTVAKETRNDESLWYNKIDAACSSLKDGETHGLLIGPHTSNLLSEVILTCVDHKLYDLGYRYIRNIDDYECYADSYEGTQMFLRDLEETLREYDLPLNHKKTTIKQLPLAVTENWIHKLNGMLNSSKENLTFPEINAFLDLAVRLSTDVGDSAILKYAIKSLSGHSMTANARKYGAQRIMHLAILHPYLLQFMDEFVFAPFGVGVESIRVFADAVYAESKRVNNYEAICYAIYFSLKHGFQLEELDIDWVIKHGDCILLLLTWKYYLKLNYGNSRATQLKPLKAEAKKLKSTDMDRYWLFCYEVLSADNLHEEWKGLKRAGVSFIKTEL